MKNPQSNHLCTNIPKKAQVKKYPIRGIPEKLQFLLTLSEHNHLLLSYGT